MAEQLQAQEREELTIKEKSKLYVQLLENRRKFFATKRAEEKRNKLPTKAQQRKIMSNYLKNMEGYKLNQLKSKSFEKIQEMFDKASKRVNTFKIFRTELVEGKEQRAEDSEQKAEEIVPDEEEVAIDVVPLATNPLSIDLKTMFEPQTVDAVWRNQLGNKVLIWKLIDSCGVQYARMQNMHIYMLVEKRYPLKPSTITDMLDMKLQADHWNEICYQLLKLITKQLKNQ
ncbi:hypothetical protein Tco_0212539 [Tanacetum coccineum]